MRFTDALMGSPANPVTPKELSPVLPRSEWDLSPELTFLNNGSFGAPPRSIRELRERFLRELEANPLRTLGEELFSRLERLALVMAPAVGVPPEDFVFVPNATFGVNAVLGSLPLTRGQEIVVHPHVYPAVLHTARRFAQLHGAQVVLTERPESPLRSAASLTAAFRDALTDRTALVIADHIASVSGIVFPVAEIAEVCRARGIPLLVDGAHAPGQIALDVSALSVDFYTGNFHKWMFAPRPAAFLYVAKRWQPHMVSPLVSNLHGLGYKSEFSWAGTTDPTPIYCTEAGYRFHQELGGERLMRRNHELAAYGGARLLEVLETHGAYSPESDFFASMFACPCPASSDRAISAVSRAASYRTRLREQAGIEAHFGAVGDDVWLRLSAHAFNGADDMDRLATALRRFPF